MIDWLIGSIPAWIVVFAAWAGVALTLLTLPGMWLALLVALLVQWWSPGMFSWWTLGIGLGIAVLGEIVESAASAAGAAATGGGKSGAMGSVIGGLGGALAGTIFLPIPILGTLIGAVAGAGAGALIAERGVSGKSWKDSARVAGGAAAGRAVALVAKTTLAFALAVLISVAAWV